MSGSGPGAMEVEPNLGKRVPKPNEMEGFYYGDKIQEEITAATKAQREKEFGIYLGKIGIKKDAFLKKLNDNNCNLDDFYTYLDALTLADENPGEPLEDLIRQLDELEMDMDMDMDGGGMRQVGGSLGPLLALHIKIFKSRDFANFSKLSLGAIVQLIQSTIDLLNSLDKCFVYYGGVFLQSAVGGMMGLCKYLYDNRDSIGQSVASGAKTAASAAGTAAVATPGVLLDIFRGVDALGMRFAEEYNPELNGFDEILDAVKRRNEEYHAMMVQLAAEQAEAAGKATARTMKLQKKRFVAQKKVDSMTAIREASEAARRLHEQLIEETAGLDHQLVMGEVGEVGEVAKKGDVVSHTPMPTGQPRVKLPGVGGPKYVPDARAGMELVDSGSDSEFEIGGKRSSKRGSRKTKTTRKKTTRKKTTRKKRRGKK